MEPLPDAVVNARTIAPPGIRKHWSTCPPNPHFLHSSHFTAGWLECKKSREGAGGEVGEKVAEHRHPLLCRGDREFGPPSADAVELGARLRRDDVAGCRPPGIRSRVA